MGETALEGATSAHNLKQINIRIEEKKKALAETSEFLAQFKGLVDRNKNVNRASCAGKGEIARARESQKMHLPFVMVASKASSQFNIKRTPDQTRILLSSSERVRIYNDFDVMKAIRKSQNAKKMAAAQMIAG